MDFIRNNESSRRKNEIISVEFSIQSTYIAILSLSFGVLIAEFILKNSLLHSLYFGPMEKIVDSFQINYASHLCIILFTCLYVGGRTFFSVNKQLVSFFYDSRAIQ